MPKQKLQQQLQQHREEPRERMDFAVDGIAAAAAQRLQSLLLRFDVIVVVAVVTEAEVVVEGWMALEHRWKSP